MRHSKRALLAAPVLASLSLIGGQASAACTFGGSSEASLQSVFDSMLGAANAPNTVSDCVTDPRDGLWQTVDSVGSATILVEIAGNASGNGLGIYDSTNANNSLEIFSGPMGPVSRAFITVSGEAGNYDVTIDRFNGNAYAGSSQGTFGSSVFGFYLQQPAGAGGERFYSESSRNPLINGDASRGSDYMYSYTGNDALFKSSSPYVPSSVRGRFGESDAIIAWEDLSQGSDGDYQDMVVLLRDIVPVPVPAAAWLLLSGFGLLAPAVRRRAQRA